MDLSTHPRTQESHLNPGASSESLSQSLPPPHGEVPKPMGTSETSRTASISPGPKPGQKKPEEAAALLKARLRTPADPAPMLLRGCGLSPRPPRRGLRGAGQVRGCSLSPPGGQGHSRVPGHSLSRLGALQDTRPGSGLGASEPRSPTAVCPEGATRDHRAAGQRLEVKSKTTADSPGLSPPPSPRALSASSSVP